MSESCEVRSSRGEPLSSESSKFGRDKSLSRDTCKVKSSQVILCLVSPGKFDRDDFGLVIPVK